MRTHHSSLLNLANYRVNLEERTLITPTKQQNKHGLYYGHISKVCQSKRHVNNAKKPPPGCLSSSQNSARTFRRIYTGVSTNHFLPKHTFCQITTSLDYCNFSISIFHTNYYVIFSCLDSKSTFLTVTGSLT